MNHDDRMVKTNKLNLKLQIYGQIYVIIEMHIYL